MLDFQQTHSGLLRELNLRCDSGRCAEASNSFTSPKAMELKWIPRDSPRMRGVGFAHVKRSDSNDPSEELSQWHECLRKELNPGLESQEARARSSARALSGVYKF